MSVGEGLYEYCVPVKMILCMMHMIHVSILKT